MGLPDPGTFPIVNIFLLLLYVCAKNKFFK